MSNDDVLFGFRLRVFALAAEIGVRPACRAMGVHHSTYYRWKRRVDRWGLEALRVRERRRPPMPNELGPHLEQRILAFALAQPGLGPRRIAAELARERWGRAQDLGQRGLARALPPRAQHSLPPPRPRRRLRRPLRAPPARTRAGAARRGLPAGRAGRGRLLLRRPPLRDEGRGLAVHRDRCRLRLRLGRAPLLAAQSPPALPLARRTGRLRARPRRLAAGSGHHR